MKSARQSALDDVFGLFLRRDLKKHSHPSRQDDELGNPDVAPDELADWVRSLVRKAH
jgi:hypothetical protein